MAEVPVNTTADEAPKITDVEAGYPSLAPTPEPKAHHDGAGVVDGLSELAVTNVLVWVFGLIAIACLAGQLDGQWSGRTWQASFALIVAIVFLSITGILVIVSFMVPRWERSSIKRYLHLEAVYHFVALVFWFTAATAVAVFISDNINNTYNYTVYWNLYYSSAESRAYVAFAYFASFAEFAAMCFAISAARRV